MRIGKLSALLFTAFLAAGCGDIGKTVNDLMVKAGFAKQQADPKGPPEGPIFGAIFTTDSSGEVVNGNIYEQKTDVYLNGGPRKPGAAGLPDGDYYYLITDPGCKTRLAGPGDATFDTSGKLIHVEDGEFTELIQLAPYDDTPNPGGEYKVYVTPVERYDDGEGCFGFIPRYTKTDNYKVRGDVTPPGNGNGGEPTVACISGYKFYDADRDGEIGSPEVPVPGVIIQLTKPDGSTLTTETSTTGQWSFCGLKPGEYHVREILPDGDTWYQTFPAVDPDEYEVFLAGLNESGVSGYGRFSLDAGGVEASIWASGYEEGLHPQHIHGLESRADATCPDISADDDKDGLISLLEGLPDYGPVVLALDPFPIVGGDGMLTFNEDYTLSPWVLEPFGHRAVVLHGLTVDSEYEPTLPVACGEIRLYTPGHDVALGTDDVTGLAFGNVCFVGTNAQPGQPAMEAFVAGGAAVLSSALVVDFFGKAITTIGELMEFLALTPDEGSEGDLAQQAVWLALYIDAGLIAADSHVYVGIGGIEFLTAQGLVDAVLGAYPFASGDMTAAHAAVLQSVIEDQRIVSGEPCE